MRRSRLTLPVLVVVALAAFACSSSDPPGSSSPSGGGAAGSAGASAGSGGGVGAAAGQAGTGAAGSAGALAGAGGEGGQSPAGSAGDTGGGGVAGAAGGSASGAGGTAGSAGAAGTAGGAAGAAGAASVCKAENTECECESGPGACAQNGCACGKSTVVDAVVPCDDFWKLHPTAKAKVDGVNLDCGDHGASSQCHVIRPGDEAASWASTYCTADDLGAFELGGAHQVKCCLPEIPDKRTDCAPQVGALCDCPDGLKGIEACHRPKGKSYCECRYAEPKPAGEGTGGCYPLPANSTFPSTCDGEELLTECGIAREGGTFSPWRAQFCKQTDVSVPYMDSVFDVFCCRPQAPE